MAITSKKIKRATFLLEEETEPGKLAGVKVSSGRFVVSELRIQSATKAEAQQLMADGKVVAVLPGKVVIEHPLVKPQTIATYLAEKPALSSSVAESLKGSALKSAVRDSAGEIAGGLRHRAPKIWGDPVEKAAIIWGTVALGAELGYWVFKSRKDNRRKQSHDAQR